MGGDGETLQDFEGANTTIFVFPILYQDKKILLSQNEGKTEEATAGYH